MYFVSFLRGLFETMLSLEPEGVRIVYKGLRFLVGASCLMGNNFPFFIVRQNLFLALSYSTLNLHCLCFFFSWVELRWFTCSDSHFSLLFWFLLFLVDLKLKV